MGETYRAEIRGQRFDVPLYIDEARTRACLEKVAKYCADAEADAPVINTQVFALQSAYRMAMEAAEIESARAEEIARLKTAHERALASAEQVTRDLEHDVAEALKGLSQALRGLLNEFGGTPSAPLKFPNRRRD